MAPSEHLLRGWVNQTTWSHITELGTSLPCEKLSSKVLSNAEMIYLLFRPVKQTGPTNQQLDSENPLTSVAPTFSQMDLMPKRHRWASAQGRLSYVRKSCQTDKAMPLADENTPAWGNSFHLPLDEPERALRATDEILPQQRLLRCVQGLFTSSRICITFFLTLHLALVQ